MLEHFIVYARVAATPKASKSIKVKLLGTSCDDASCAQLRALAHDQLAMWALNAVHVRNGQPPPWGLLALPEGILSRMLTNLGRDDLLSCSCVCKAMKSAADAESQWERLLAADFNASADAPPVRPYTCKGVHLHMRNM